MKVSNVLRLAVLFLLFASVSLAQTSGSISNLSADPGTLTSGLGTRVTFTCRVVDLNVVAGGMQVQRLNPAGAVTGTLGIMRDDGLGGDAQAGDGTYTSVLNLYETTPGLIRLRVSAAIQGSARRTLSPVLDLTVTGTATSIRILSPAADSYLNLGPVPVQGEIGDPSVNVTVNGIPASKSGTNFAASVPLIEGTNTITAVATGPGGTTGSNSVQVFLDTTPPHVAITSPVDGGHTINASVDVTGIINDIVVGTVNSQQATVTVNGVAAAVSNRTFSSTGVPLVIGPNQIRAEGRDRVGNTFAQIITVTRDPVQSGTPTLSAVSGNNQTGAINTPLPLPLVVRLTNAQNQPASNVPVTFRVTESDGLVGSLPAVVVNTNGQGQAQVTYKLGSRAGAGSNRVDAMASGFQGSATFVATALAGAPSKIVVDSGLNQTGPIGQGLPFPFIAIVTDGGNNRLGGVPVTFSVKSGGGNINGLTTFNTTSDSDGRVSATLTLGLEEGISNNLAEASFVGNPGQPAAFTASALTPGDASQTTISGVVLDNSNQPIPNVTIRMFRVALGQNNVLPLEIGNPALTDAQGTFRVANAPVGIMKLMADGSTAAPAGAWPTLEYDLLTVAGRDNTLGVPVYLPHLDLVNRLCVTATTGGTLTLPQVPGFSLTVAPGAATFPGGARNGCVSVTPVNPDKVPMAPGFGQQPRFVVTIQPVGTTFNPPARIQIPNVDGLQPRAKTEMYSYDHDLAAFVAIGTGTVSEDASVIASDAGVGVMKAGWHCGGDPNPTGSAGDCGQCAKCVNSECQEDVAKRGQVCDLSGSQKGACQSGYCKPVQVQILVNNTAVTTDDITALNGAQTLPVTIKMTQGPTTPVTITLDISPARGAVSPASVSLANGQSAVVTITPSTKSAAVNDARITAKYSGTDAGTGNFTVVNITLPPKVRRPNTPATMAPDRIPPRVDTQFEVKVEPDLGTSGQIVTLARLGNSANNGDFSINGNNTLDMTTTANVQLRGVTQTAATGGAGGGNAGNLRLIARVRAAQVEQSPGFSVAALAENYTDRLVGPVTAAGSLGIIVQDGWVSDSGVVADLDAVDLSEQVEITTATGVFMGLGAANSGYLPATSFTQDTHSTPDTVLTGPAGQRIAQQTNIFRDRRTGVADIPMTNSGYTITRNLFFEAASPAFPMGRFRLTTTKVGAATTANTYASGAGAILGGAATATQPTP